MKELDQHSEQPADKSLLAQTKEILTRYSDDISIAGATTEHKDTYHGKTRPNEEIVFFVAPTTPSSSFKELTEFTENIAGNLQQVEQPEGSFLAKGHSPRPIRSGKQILVGDITMSELIEEKETTVYGDLEGITKIETTIVWDKGTRDISELPEVLQEQLIHVTEGFSGREIKVKVYPDEEAASLAHQVVTGAKSKEIDKRIGREFGGMLQDIPLLDKLGEKIGKHRDPSIVKVPKGFIE